MTTQLNFWRTHLMCLAAGFAAAAFTGTAAQPLPVSSLPADSVYQLAVPLTDQQGRAAALAERRGQPQLVSMFYTSCEFTCPLLVETLQAVEAASGLGPAEQARLGLLLVSFDPEHDSVAVLHQTAAQRGLQSPHWTLARTDARHARQLAALLGIQYRALAGGDFNHTSAIILLDAQGRVAARTQQLGGVDPAFARAVREVVRNPR